jgi:hypothetical protein
MVPVKKFMLSMVSPHFEVAFSGFAHKNTTVYICKRWLLVIEKRQTVAPESFTFPDYA